MYKLLIHFSIIAITIVSAQAYAGPREEGGGANAGIQRLLRQLTAERDQLLAEKQQLLTEAESKDKEITKLSKKMDGKENTLGKYKDVNAKLVERLKLAQEKMVEMNTAYRELQANANQLQLEKTELEATSASQQEDIERHIKNNHRMLEINSELLGKYKNKGFFTLLSKKEPMTQLNKVAIENLIQEYQFELEDLEALESDETGELLDTVTQN